MLSNFFNHAVNGMSKNIVEPGGPQMTVWRMHIACWITKATNTHSDYTILISVPRQLCLHESASMLRYTYSTLPVLFLFSVFNMSNLTKSVMSYAEEIPIEAGMLWVNTNKRTRCRHV